MQGIVKQFGANTEILHKTTKENENLKKKIDSLQNDMNRNQKEFDDLIFASFVKENPV